MAIIHFISVMFERMYSTIGALSSWTEQARGGALGRGVESSKACSTFQVRQAFDLEDAAGEDVLLALLLDGQEPALIA